MIRLGLDIGTNSVGSAWADFETGEIRSGVSIFPAGVEETDQGRGEPKGQERRQKRQLMRLLRRKAARRHKLLMELISRGLLPADAKEREKLFGLGDYTKGQTPWHLRRKAMAEELTLYEFGRVLVHINQRRGAFGVRVEKHEDDQAAEDVAVEMRGKKPKKTKEADTGDDGKVKEGIKKAESWMAGRTFGQAMADELDQRLTPTGNDGKQYVAAPVRNRGGTYALVASRDMIRDEFLAIWKKQAEFKGALAKLLTDEFKKVLDDPDPKEQKISKTWRHAGLIFGQRRHYWDIGTLGRCDLEPTERCCPLADRHAQYFRVLETVNNIRIQTRGNGGFWRPLSESEREAVITRLRTQKTGSVNAVREAMGIDKRTLKKQGGRNTEDYYRLNLEADKEREINTDWVYREVVLGVMGLPAWENMEENQREAINRALLRFDTDTPGDDAKLAAIAGKHWELNAEQTGKLVAVWRKRPKVEQRLKLSRGALLNLIPYMQQTATNKQDEPTWRTVTEARQAFAEDATNGATPEQRARYAFWVSPRLRDLLLRQAGGDEDAVRRLLSLRGFSADDRHYLKKHRQETGNELMLPPAPMLANPVVRKAIFAVRAHVNAYLVKYKKKPDQIVIELARDATQPKKLRDQELSLIRDREKVRRGIVIEHNLTGLSKSQREKATERVLLALQQKEQSAYSGRCLDVHVAAAGRHPEFGEVEVDHIIPRACGGGDGINNLVICYADENRDKGKRSPKQWKHGSAFELIEQIFGPLVADWKRASALGYFTWRDCKAKWDNLHKDPKEVTDDFSPSQLNDTSYAAREVAAYLQASLYPDEPLDSADVTKRRILFTKGRYTAKLRADWELYQDCARVNGEVPMKDRRDHRHHAIDAAIIALTTGNTLQLAARMTRDFEERRLDAKQKGENIQCIPKPLPVAVPSPWNSIEALRTAVIEPLYRPATGDLDADWAVSHKAQNRRIAGAFHQETLYGPVLTDPKRFTCRIGVADLKAGYLKLSPQQKDALGENKKIDLKDDPSIDSNSYLVRDLSLRLQLRKCVQNAGFDPDKLTEKDSAIIAKKGKFRFDGSGIPIRQVVCVRTIDSPARIARDGDGRADRVYIGQSNHHIEIRVDNKGRWYGDVLSTFEAAKRKQAWMKSRRQAETTLHQSNADDSIQKQLQEARRAAQAANPIVDRRDNLDGRFVMSLSVGETVLMKHPDTGMPGVFVVFKIKANKVIYFTTHTDGRRASGEKENGQLIGDSLREEILTSPRQLQGRGLSEGKPPVKVRVSPLGELNVLERD